MKNITLLFFIALFIASCGDQAPAANDVAAKKTLLKEKKTAYKVLQGEIVELEAEILKLEPLKEKAPILVNVSEIKEETFKRFISIQGSVESDDVVNVTSDVAGRIISLTVEEGHNVRKGQVIATLDMETMKNQIIEIETALSLAVTVYERQKRLWDQQIGSEIQYLQAKNNKERSEKSLETLKSQLSKQYVYAPISGVIDRKFLSNGEIASPGMPIVNILNTNKVKVVADIPEVYLGSIKKGDKVEIFIPALNKSIEERITMIGRTIDPANRTFKIEMETLNRDNVLKPNLLAEVKFNDYTKIDAIVAPVDYIMEEVSGDKYIFIEKPSGNKSIASKVYVSIGENYNGMVVVEEGLKAGDKMITEGSRNVNNNDPIITNQ